jgi:hypothetical protein
VGSRSGLDPNPQPNTTAQPLVQVFGQRASDSHIIVLSISVPASRFFPRDANLGFFDAFAIAIDFDPATSTSTPLGFALGTLTLSQASTTSNAMVVGSFDTNLDTQGTPP